MSAGNPPPSRRTVQPASDTRRRRATGPAASPARRCPTRHAHDRQMSPPSRKTPLPMIVHLPGEAKASKELCSCPANAPIRPISAIAQLPDLGSLLRSDIVRDVGLVKEKQRKALERLSRKSA